MSHEVFESRGSWVAGADTSGFSLANLCHGVAAGPSGPRLVVAIGDYALDLAACAGAGLLSDSEIDPSVWSAPSLNSFLALGSDKHGHVRARIHELLSDEEKRSDVERCLVQRDRLRLECPIQPGDFVDFYSSYYHVVRAMEAAGVADARVDENWRAMPVGYHSRAGTIVGSGAQIPRPCGQYLSKSGPEFGPTHALDFELEVGFVACGSTNLGDRLTPDDFPRHIFGLVLLNDWSARDFQAWESRPLGPLLAKSFATQVGCWVVPLAALEEARRPVPSQSEVLPYLRHTKRWGFDVKLDAGIQSTTMRQQGLAPTIVTETNLKHLYWDGAQQLAHATANGACIRPGDLFGSGTASGPTLESSACLLERTHAARDPVTLADGTARGWLSDGDRLVIRGQAPGPGGVEISFGELWGEINVARSA